MRGPATTSRGIQSVERAALILGLFTSEKPRVTLAEMSAALGLGKATTHRYAVSLRNAGLLCYHPESNLYSVGSQAIALAGAAFAGVSLLSAAQVHMRLLSDKIEDTVALSVWDGLAPIILHSVSPTSRGIAPAVRVGSRLSEDRAQSKVFRAYDPEIRAESRSGESEKESEQIRRIGVAFAGGDGWRAVASPVFDGEQVVATLAVLGVAERIQEDPDSPVCVELRTTAAELSKEITASLGQLSNQ